ncbi:MAG: hypothetical protein JWR36_1480, partial [Glaciihabitans sp.]|nr:hypothetical protein [Glaciihabitans sp.]
MSAPWVPLVIGIVAIPIGLGIFKARVAIAKFQSDITR